MSITVQYLWLLACRADRAEGNDMPAPPLHDGGKSTEVGATADALTGDEGLGVGSWGGCGGRALGRRIGCG